MSTDDAGSLKSFMRAARNSHIDLRCAKISDSLWALYMLQLTESYSRSPEYVVKTLVANVGRQNGTKVWVFAPDTQIGGDGCTIPTSRQEYYW